LFDYYRQFQKSVVQNEVCGDCCVERGILKLSAECRRVDQQRLFIHLVYHGHAGSLPSAAEKG
jgi:sulfur relay (sulfurtransferase) complex TusBCD TusD component (DsrE family)